MNVVKLSAQIDPGKILAVVPTLNEEAYIETCVRSLMNGHKNLRQVMLVIADGGSSDRTCDIVKQLQGEFSNLHLLHNPKRLQSAAINLAAKQFCSEHTEFLIRCDAHSIYPENFILDVAHSLARTGADSVVIPMDAVGSTCFEKANAWIVDTPLGSGGAAHRGGTKSGYVDHGHHAGFRMATFNDVGGYDETFSHNEDAEYDQRVRQSGGQIYLDADIRIKYVPRGSLSSLSRQYFNYGKGRARNVAKHGQRLRLRQLAPVAVLIVNIFGILAGLFFWPFLFLPAGYAAILALTSIWMAISKKSWCGLWSGPALAAMHMSWATGFLKQKNTFKSGNSVSNDYISKESTR